MFGLFRTFRKPAKTASTAKERLQILVAHDRATKASADLVPVLRRDILEVVRRHLSVSPDHVDVRMGQGEGCQTLEINIEVPEDAPVTATCPTPIHA